MDADERLAIVDLLQGRPTGVLRNYFAALGFGDAWDRPSKGWGKGKRIAEVLKDATRDGRAEEILDHARRYFDISAPTAHKSRPAGPARYVNDNHQIDQGDLHDMSAPTPDTAFIVHGHDPANYREIVARLIERSTDLEAVILDEQPNLGLHLLEKLKAYGTESCIAIVLLSGDDRGRAATRSPDDDQPRARQNVILELGYFIGKLPPKHVIVLYGPGVEIPSDLLGVAYHQLDTDNWRYKLANELHAIGIKVNFPI